MEQKLLHPDKAEPQSKNLEKIISSPEEEKAVETALGMEVTHVTPAPQTTPTPTTGTGGWTDTPTTGAGGGIGGGTETVTEAVIGG